MRTEYKQRLPEGVDEAFILPCGHSVQQGRYLDCDLDGCRKTDEEISRKYWEERKYGIGVSAEGTNLKGGKS